jgi:UDPglucose 6-dehydrogenase
MKVSVVGAGYVGLVTGACLAKLGRTVRCIDIDSVRIGQLLRGEMPIAEPGLQQLVRLGQKAGTLTFHVSHEAARDTELMIVAVDTLDAGGNWTADAVLRAVTDLAADTTLPRRIVVRSTLMPGTAVRLLAAARRHDPGVEMAHNPEFTREGSAVADFLSPERIVIGVERSAGLSALAQMVGRLYEGVPAPVIVTDLTTSETIKVASNVFLATKIAFANELARLCAAAGADVHTVVDAMGRDPRIGRAFLSPGPGFGGACLPSQARALPIAANGLGVRTPLIDSVAHSNDEAMRWIVEVAKSNLGGSAEDRTVAILGLTFKAGTDDLRDSPAIFVARLLAEGGATLRLYDPTDARRALSLIQRAGADVTAFDAATDAVAGSDAVIVMTEWPEFQTLDWPSIAKQMRGHVVVDGRGVLDSAAALKAGLHVVGVVRSAEARQTLPGQAK